MAMNLGNAAPLRRTLGLLLLLTPAVWLTRERDARAAGPHYKRLCNPATEGGEKTCHAWLLVDDDDQPVVSAAPSGLGATDLQQAYHLPKTGGNGRIIATQLGTHYPNAEADLNVYRKQYGLPECTKANGCFIQVDGNGGTNFPPADKCN